MASQPEKRKRSKHQFFIVFSPEGLAPPKIVHPTHKGAMYAAAQMAKFNPEASFFVMGSMSGRVIPRTEEADPDALTGCADDQTFAQEAA
jgi:hypothetical protein